MTEYREEDFLMLSGIQHFAFCRRQWALIHIEGVWTENGRTAEGRVLHDKAHDAFVSESRGSAVISRSMPVFSRTLGMSGECDTVEFHKSEKGITLSGRPGLWTVYPVEYKRGKPKADSCDILQVTAQAMCLEEMLCCTVSEGALFYFETRRRLPVEITGDLRETARQYAAEMHSCAERAYLPKGLRKGICFVLSAVALLTGGVD